jgi:hypothetical protein
MIPQDAPKKRVRFFTPDEVRQMIIDGRISEDRTAAVLSRYLASRA